MSPRDMFIRYLVTNGYIEEEMLQRATEQQEKSGGEILDILLDMLMRQREQMQFVENLSKDNPGGKRIGYVSSAENQIPPLLQKFLEFSKQQSEGGGHTELLPTVALEAPDLPSLPRTPSQSAIYYTSPPQEGIIAQSNPDSFAPSSPSSGSLQARGKSTSSRLGSSAYPLLPNGTGKSKLSETIARDSWQQRLIETSEFPLDDELLRYADAFQTICEVQIPSALSSAYQEKMQQLQEDREEDLVNIVGIELPQEDDVEIIDDVSEFFHLGEVHASSDMLASSSYTSSQAVSYKDITTPLSSGGLYEHTDPYAPGPPRSIGTPSQASQSQFPVVEAHEPSFIPYRINGSQASLDALPSHLHHGSQEQWQEPASQNLNHTLAPLHESHNDLHPVQARSQSAMDQHTSRSKLSLDQLPVATAKQYPTGPSSPSYQSIYGLSTRCKPNLRGISASRDALLASSPGGDRKKARGIRATEKGPRDSAHDLRALSSREMLASHTTSPSRANMYAPSRGNLPAHARDRLSASRTNMSSPSHANMISPSRGNLIAASHANMSAASHANLISPSRANMASPSHANLIAPAHGQKVSVSYGNTRAASQDSMSSYEIAPVVEPPEHTHYSRPLLPEVEEERGISWKWFSFFILSLLALCALIGGAFSYHKFMSKSVDASPSTNRPTSPR